MIVQIKNFKVECVYRNGTGKRVYIVDTNMTIDRIIIKYPNIKIMSGILC